MNEMSSHHKERGNLVNPREEELETIRSKLLDAIRYSERYWMTFKEETFGLATILDLIYKKSYIEVLFFSNRDVLEKGKPLIKINTPIEMQVNFDEVIFEPDFGEDGLINPTKIIERINNIIDKEFEKHLERLEKQVELLDIKFESHPIQKNPYHRNVRVYFTDFYLSFEINFENYPLIPRFRFSREMNRIVTSEEFMQSAIFSQWDEINPPYVVDIIDTLIKIICERINRPILKENTQHLILDDFTASDKLRDISVKIHPGKTLGIYYNQAFLDEPLEKSEILNLYRSIAGTYDQYSGQIYYFGRNIREIEQEEMRDIYVVSQAIDSELETKSVKRAITHKNSIIPIRKELRSKLDEILREAGISTLLEEAISLRKRFRGKLRRKNEILDAIGLLNRRNDKISSLTRVERLLFSIGRILVRNPKIIMFSFPEKELGRLELNKFAYYMNRIKNKFHLILFIQGPKDIISECDTILTISHNITKIGSIDEYIRTIPQAGEVITIELSDPDQNDITQMLSMQNAKFVEERRREKYKVFPKEKSTEIILEILNIFGPSLQNFKISRASLTEYLEYMEK